MTNSLFKEDADGNIIFYPWGILGKGFIIENQSLEYKIRRFIFKYNMASVICILILSISLGWLFCLCIIPIFMTIWMVKVKYFIKMSKSTNIKLPFTSNQKKFFSNRKT